MTTAFGGVYENKRVLITGHTGFKGSWLTSWLLKHGAIVAGYSKDIPTSPSLFDLAGLEGRIEHNIADVRDVASLRQVVESFRPDFVFHLAAQAIVSTSFHDPVETITTNVVGMMAIMEVLRGVDWPCVSIIITSDKCYDNVEWVWGYRETDALGGKDIYSGSKGAAELIFKSYYHTFFGADHAVRFAVARAGNVIGGGDWAADRIIADCVRAWMTDKKVQIRSPAATRPWQHVLEPLSGYLTLGQRLAQAAKFGGEAYNFGPRGEQNRTVVEVLSRLAGIWGFESADGAFEIVGNSPFHEASLLKLNCDKALLDLNWEANLAYDECMDMTGTWYRDVLRDKRDAATCTDEHIAHFESLAAERSRCWTR